MTEHFDVADLYPDVVKSMLELFDSLNKEYHPPGNAPENKDAYVAYVNAHRGFLGPFAGYGSASREDAP